MTPPSAQDFPFTKWQFLMRKGTVALRSRWTESRVKSGKQVAQGIGRNYVDLQSQVTGPVLNRIWTFPGSKYAKKGNTRSSRSSTSSALSDFFDNFDEFCAD